MTPETLAFMCWLCADPGRVAMLRKTGMAALRRWRWRGIDLGLEVRAGRLWAPAFAPSGAYGPEIVPLDPPAAA